MDTLLATRSEPTSRRKGAGIPWAAVGVAVGCASPFAAARAQDAAIAAVPGVSQAEAMGSLLGRIAPVGLTTAAPRVTVEDAHLLDSERDQVGRAGFDAYGRPLTEVGGVTYRWWLGRGASHVGVGLGTTGYLSAPPDATGPARQFIPGGSVLTVGWRYQFADQSTVFADASGARRFDADTANRFSTKVGVEWKSRTSKFGFDGVSRSLALRLDSGYRMSLRVRKNGFGVFVKGQF